MKMKWRYFFGGIMGSAIGIIIAGIFENHYLLGLAFPGAFIGYHADKVRDSFVAGYKAGLETYNKVDLALRGFCNRPLISSKKLTVNCGWIAKLVTTMFAVIIWLICTPVRFSRWLERSPVHRAHFMSIIVALGYLGLASIVLFVTSIELLSPVTIETNMQGKTFVHFARFADYMFLTILGLLFFYVIPVAFFLAKRLEGTEGYYRKKGRYTRKGPVAWVMRDIKTIVTIQIAWIYFIVTGLTYIVAVGGLMVVFLFIPATGLFFAVHGLYRAVAKNGGWTCATVTTVMTVISGLTFWNQIISNFTLSWLISLTTGSIAGWMSWEISQKFEKLSRNNFISDILKYETIDFDRFACSLTKPIFKSIFSNGLKRITQPAISVIYR